MEELEVVSNQKININFIVIRKPNWKSVRLFCYCLIIYLHEKIQFLKIAFIFAVNTLLTKNFNRTKPLNCLRISKYV